MSDELFIPAGIVETFLAAIRDALNVPRPADHSDTATFLNIQRDRAVAVTSALQNLTGHGETTRGGLETATWTLRDVAGEALPYSSRK